MASDPAQPMQAVIGEAEPGAELANLLAEAQAAMDVGDLGAALAHCEAAHRRAPLDLAPIGVALRLLETRDTGEVLTDWADRGLALSPSNLALLMFKAFSLELLGHFDIAVAYWRRAAAVRGDTGAFELEIGRSLLHANALKEAGEVLGGALARAPSDPLRASLERTLGEALLKAADISGFKLFQARDRSDGAAFEIDSVARWGGEDLRGRRLLVTHQLGYGDQMMLAPMAATLVRRGAKLALTCDLPVFQLLSNSLPAVEVIGMQARPIRPGYPAPEELLRAVEALAPDYYGSLLGVCAQLNVEEVAAGANGAPLQAPREARARVGAQVAALRALHPGKRLVGLVFDCAQRHSRVLDGFHRAYALRRSVPADIIQRLTASAALVATHHFVSLHDPRHERDIGAAPANVSVLDPEVFADFAGTAAIIEGLDEVIAVDCAVANLAGKLGAPTRVLLQHGGEWRWGASGPTTLWLPAVRLYRQPTPTDWAPVIDQLIAEMAASAGPVPA